MIKTLTTSICNERKDNEGMNITSVNVRRLYNEGNMRALVSITVDNDLAVHDIKVIEVVAENRIFVAFPSRREQNGIYRDVCHPIDKEARQVAEELILDAYYAEVEANKNQIEVVKGDIYPTSIA